MDLYPVKKSIKAFLHGIIKKISAQGWRLSRFFPFVKPFAEWLGMPPLAPKGQLALIEARTVNFKLELSEKDPSISPRIFANRIWEKQETYLLENILEPGAYVLDLGAHFGYYSILAGKKVGPKGRVFAFEPDEFNFGILKRNIALNQLDGIVIPIQKAVGNRNEVKILYGASASDSSDRILFPTGEEKVSQQIECVRVDDYLESHDPEALSKIRVVKMDVEGFEVFALEGLKKILESPEITLFTEINYRRISQAGTSAEIYLRELVSLGFYIYTINPREEEKESALLEIPIADLAKEAEYHVDLYCTKSKIHFGPSL